MDRLWTPWRLAYVTDASTHVPDCIFCDAARAHDPLVVHETRLSFVILNKYPYNNGHLMVVPRRHVGWLAELTPAVYTEFLDDRFVAAIDLGYSRRDFRVGYLVRAVTPGVYSLPAAEVEDMYQPQYRARTAMGKVTVTPAQ